MGKAAQILTCAFYLLLFHFDQFVLANPTENRKSLDRVRPAEAACEKFKKLATELNQSERFAGSTAETAETVFESFRAKEGEFPYMAAVGYSSDDESSTNLKYPCAGTLISEKHVLTTAHCVRVSKGEYPNEIMLGVTDQVDDSHLRQRLMISRIVKHPQYDQKLKYHDIAIIELADPVRFTKSAQPTCLMTEPLTTKTEGADSSMVVLGWRDIEREKNSTKILVKVENQKFVENSECSKSYSQDSASRRSLPNGFDDGMICVAKSDDTGEGDPCWGTSGAPVLIPSTKYGFRTAGFSSFGYRCGHGVNPPSVAVSVYKYLDWIEDQVWPTKTL